MKYLRAKRAIYFGNLNTLERTHGFKIFHVSTLILFIKMAMIILLYMVATNSVEITEYKPIGDTDYLLLIDDSSSMAKTDFRPNRLASAKDISTRWLSIAPNQTAIGMVAFSQNIDEFAPLTTDKSLVRNKINDLTIDYSRSGTDIDFAIDYGVELLLDSGRKRTLLLFTDGTQPISNETIDKAVRNEVRVIAFGIGNSSVQNASFDDVFDEDIPQDVREELLNSYSDLGMDFSILENLAMQTGGMAFQITNELELEESFQAATLEQVNKRIDSAFYVTMFIAIISILELLIFARLGAL